MTASAMYVGCMALGGLGLTGAAVCAARTRLIPLVPWTGGASLLTVFGGALLLRTHLAPLQLSALACAFLALSWSGCYLAWQHGFQKNHRADLAEATPFALAMSLFMSVAAAVLELISLAIRSLLTVSEMIAGAPTYRSDAGHHDWLCLIGIAVLMLVCRIAWQATRRDILATVLFWLTGMGAMRAALLVPTFRLDQHPIPHRGILTLVLMVSMAAWLWVGVLAWSAAVRARQRSIMPGILCPPSPATEDTHWPGFRISCQVVAVTLTLLVVLHYAAPLDVRPGGFRLVAVVCTLVAAASACSLLLLRDGSRGRSLPDTAMGLASLVPCGAMLALVPQEPSLLSVRYPMVFNAVMVGCAMSTLFWAWLGSSDRWMHIRQLPVPDTQFIRRHARRFVFATGLLGVLVSFAMMIWPRLGSVAVSDDSAGRLMSGCAGNALLTLSLLFAAERLGRITLYMLTLTAALLTAGFVAVRAAPWASPMF